MNTNVFQKIYCILSDLRDISVDFGDLRDTILGCISFDAGA